MSHLQRTAGRSEEGGHRLELESGEFLMQKPETANNKSGNSDDMNVKSFQTPNTKGKQTHKSPSTGLKVKLSVKNIFATY